MRNAVFAVAGCLVAIAITFACGGDDGDDGSSGGSSGQPPGSVGGGAIDAGGIVLDDSGVPTIPPPSCPDPAAGSKIFYVDGTAGDDAKDGTSEATAWKTINHAVGQKSSIAAGATVLIKKGFYRERVHMQKSGTAAARILVRPFDKDRVVIDGSDSPGAWTLDSGDVYKSHPAFAVQAVVADGVPLIPATSRAAMAAGQYFSSGSDLFVWANAGGDPTTKEVGVIAVDDAKAQNVFWLDSNYVTLCGVTTRFGGAKGVYMRGDFDHVEQCHVEHNGGIGLSMEPDDGIQCTDSEITANEINDNYLRNFPRCGPDYKFGGWGTGASCQGSPNSKFLRNVVHDNGGEGIVVFGPNATIQGNISYDNWSVNIYVLNSHDITVDGNLVFSTGPKLAYLTNNKDPDPSDNRCARTLRPIGVSTGDEDLGSPGALTNVKIVNNIMIGNRYGTTHIGESNGSGIKQQTIANNTIILPDTIAAYETVSGIDIPFQDGNNAGSKIQNNVIYGNGAGSLLSGFGGTATTGLNGITMDHNAWFHGTNAKAWNWQGNTYDHAAWAALGGTAHGAGDVLGDPSLVDTSTTLRDPTSKCPKAGSPLLDVAVDVGVTSDFFGTPRPQKAGPDMGACEVK